MCCVCKVWQILDPQAHVGETANTVGNLSFVHTRYGGWYFMDEIWGTIFRLIEWQTSADVQGWSRYMGGFFENKNKKAHLLQQQGFCCTSSNHKLPQGGHKLPLIVLRHPDWCRENQYAKKWQIHSKILRSALSAVPVLPLGDPLSTYVQLCSAGL